MISIHLENLKNDYEKLGNDDQNAAAKKKQLQKLSNNNEINSKNEWAKYLRQDFK